RGLPAVGVPMDGFHLADAALDALGRRDRKGAVDTFDAHGYLALLRRLRGPDPATVYAPEFRREIEEPIAGAVPVAPSVPLVITEGNYLLVDDDPWGQLNGLLDETWYLDVDEPERLRRLVDRHMAYGRDEATARARALGSDQRNAELIIATRVRADLLVRLP
ncbi:MAG TPA: nucleoside/nucleotide kinase family protein, partial [Catenuloplanes sp.]